jgi:hypothetical protein
MPKLHGLICDDLNQRGFLIMENLIFDMVLPIQVDLKIGMS